MNLSEKIIYDVGANNGDDTDFYLRKGFRVVAVEADPELASALTKRFADQIAEGRLTVLAEGAGEAHETLAFTAARTNGTGALSTRARLLRPPTTCSRYPCAPCQK